MAAIVEDSVQREAHEQLLLTYKALTVPVSRNLTQEQVALVVDAYMSGFVMNTNLTDVTAHELLQ
jgi:hypothetical protein